MEVVPVLTTERLLLRGAEASDFEASAAMWGDPDVVKFIGGQTRGRQDAWFTMCRMRGMWDILGYGNWTVCDRATGRFLGEVCLANFMRGLEPDISHLPEAGWAYATHAHGKGYATEALHAVLDWSDRVLRAPLIFCVIDPDHAASQRVAEKCGFRFARMTTYRDNDIGLYERQMGDQNL